MHLYIKYKNQITTSLIIKKKTVHVKNNKHLQYKTQPLLHLNDINLFKDNMNGE